MASVETQVSNQLENINSQKSWTKKQKEFRKNLLLEQREKAINELNKDISRETATYINRENIRANVDIFALKEHIIALYPDLIDNTKALIKIYEDVGYSKETIDLLKENIEIYKKSLERFMSLEYKDPVEIEPISKKKEKLEIDDFEKDLMNKYEDESGKKAIEKGKFTKDYNSWKEKEGY